MIKIISDSTCDLTNELLERYNISIIPLHVLLGDKDYLDGVDISPDTIYKWADETKSMPQTSAPSIGDAMEILKPFVDAGDDIICFSIAKSMSTSNNIMRLAAEALEYSHKTYVIDSTNLSTGVGHLVIEAAIMAKEGIPAADIVEKVKAMRASVRSSFVIDTLTYLHRGGRCSAVAALTGNVLQLHPMIKVENGKMDVDKKYRGKLSTVIPAYVKDLEDALKNAKKDRVFITHSGCDEAIIKDVCEYIQNLNLFNEVLVTRAGAVISSHCGPGTLGVLYIEK